MGLLKGVVGDLVCKARTRSLGGHTKLYCDERSPMEMIVL